MVYELEQVLWVCDQIKFYSAFKQTNNNNNIHTYININTERAGKEVIITITMAFYAACQRHMMVQYCCGSGSTNKLFCKCFLL